MTTPFASGGKSTRSRLRILLSVWLVLSAGAARAGPLIISTGKVAEDYAWTPLEFEIRGVPESLTVTLTSFTTREPVPCQIIERSTEGIRIAWIAENLRKGSEGLWLVRLAPVDAAKEAKRVEVKKGGPGVLAIRIDGKDFTRLCFGTGQFKPYFFPVIGPNKRMITRQYPMKKGVKGEDQDHPHHRSLWFDHGDVNGVDFWAEGPGKGRIRQVAVPVIETGPVLGKIVTLNEWIAPGGKKLLKDRRVITVYPLQRGEVLFDIAVTLTPAGDAVRFGDTKEGTLGIRLAESMKETRGGTILNSAGQRGMREAWGKPAEWVDYCGTVAGETVGIAVLDHPESFRHPTTWHVRDYGLLAANPFGYHDFKYGGKDGSYTLQPGRSLEFRYRLYLHRGSTQAARVADVYRGFASPPPLHPRV